MEIRLRSKGHATSLSIAIGLLLVAGLSAQLPIPDLYSLRATGRASLSTPVWKAVNAGLNWLALHQETNGYWDPAKFMKHDPVGFRCTGAGNPIHRVGVTGIALLGFLADNNTLYHGHHREVVKKGIAWLLQQQATKGPASGLIGPDAGHHYIHGHLFATHALLEAYGLSRAPHLKAKAEAAVNYIQRHRHPDYAWRYRPQMKEEDTPVTVLAFVVLRIAQEFGIKIDDSHAAMTERFLNKVTSADGITGYTNTTAGSSRHPGEHGTRFPPEDHPTLTAASLACRFMLGQRLDQTPVMRRQVAIVLAHLPSQADFYYWYYASMAMKQVGGNNWTKWSRAVNKKLLGLQRKDDSTKGSWDIDTVWGADGGRVYTTAIAVLTLQAEYRYARISESTPVSADLARFGLIRRRWIERDFGGVLRARNALCAEPESLSSDEQKARIALDAALDLECNRALQEIKQLGSGPDFLAARDGLKDIAKAYNGMPPAKQANSMLQTFAKSKGIRREITAMTAYRRATQRKRGRHKALRRLATNYEGTYAATLAVRDMASKRKE